MIPSGRIKYVYQDAYTENTQSLLNNETVHIQERTGLECTELDRQTK